MNNDENKNDKKTEGDDYVFDFGRGEKNDGQPFVFFRFAFFSEPTSPGMFPLCS